MRLVIALARTVTCLPRPLPSPPNSISYSWVAEKTRRGFCKGLWQRNGRWILFQLQSSLQRPSEQVFFLLISTFNEKDNVIESYYLSRIFQNPEYGTFAQSTKLGVFECNVLNTICSSSSKSEWTISSSHI